MPRNLVLFDLEWNIGYQPYTFNYHGVQQTFRGEIVEIGAVKIDEDANVLDTFSIHLRPRIFRKLQHHIAKVTGLTQADLDKGEPIVQGLRRFMQWCGPDAKTVQQSFPELQRSQLAQTKVHCAHPSLPPALSHPQVPLSVVYPYCMTQA